MDELNINQAIDRTVKHLVEALAIDGSITGGLMTNTGRVHVQKQVISLRRLQAADSVGRPRPFVARGKSRADTEACT